MSHTHTHTEVLVRCPYFQGSNHMQETLVGESNVDKFPQEFSWRGVPLYCYDPVSIWFSLSLSLSLSLFFSTSLTLLNSSSPHSSLTLSLNNTRSNTGLPYSSPLVVMMARNPGFAGPWEIFCIRTTADSNNTRYVGRPFISLS